METRTTKKRRIGKRMMAALVLAVMLGVMQPMGADMAQAAEPAESDVLTESEAVLSKTTTKQAKGYKKLTEIFKDEICYAYEMGACDATVKNTAPIISNLWRRPAPMIISIIMSRRTQAPASNKSRRM